MLTIIIDEEFKSLLPALDKETYAWLEENLIEYGCREPLVLWEGILIDGHNRYEISLKHGLPFNTVNMEFDSRDNVLIWIISTQVSRRNLTPFQLSFYRGLHYGADRRTHGDSDRFTLPDPSGQNVHLQESTANRLAEQYNVSSRTIRRDAQFAEAITAIGRTSPVAKRDILAGKTRISKKKLCELSAGPEEDFIEVAERIEKGTFERIVHEPVELQPLAKDFKRITDGFYRELRGHTKNGDTDALKSAFRAYIETLENMYGHI